ncbi:MAG TPA: hypothetical protein VER08_10160 [Pyrinomonadaceae bacterium]|nr:hypothetical protein [Pyrinomonadaceae bacterium]
MGPALHVSFESPQSGFMSLGLRAGESRLVLGAACAPYDSLRELVEALSALLAEGGRVRRVARWNCEPEEYDFELSAEGASASLTVTRHPAHARRAEDARAVFAYDAPRLALVLPFWRELRELRRRRAEDVFEKNWRRDFPDAELRELTRLVRARRREEKKE